MNSPASLPVWALVSGLAGEQRKRRLLFVLQAVIDDSGNGQPPILVLAGFVARAESWAAFADKWQAALSEGGLAYFKMKECASLRGQFADWRSDHRDYKLMELANIIKETVIASTFAIVRHDEYLDFLAKHGSPPKMMRSPYFLLYNSVISAILRSMRKMEMSEKVDFIFDEQFKLSDAVQSAFSQTVSIMEPTLLVHLGGRPIHKNDKSFLPLQAADMLAWHIRRWYGDDANGIKFESAVMSLLRTIKFWGMVHNSSSLNTLGDISNLVHQVRQVREYFSSPELHAEILKTLKDQPKD